MDTITNCRQQAHRSTQTHNCRWVCPWTHGRKQDSDSERLSPRQQLRHETHQQTLPRTRTQTAYDHTRTLHRRQRKIYLHVGVHIQPISRALLRDITTLARKITPTGNTHNDYYNTEEPHVLGILKTRHMPHRQYNKIHDKATVPRNATEGSAAFDLTTIEDIKLQPREWKAIHTGIELVVPHNVAGQMWPRSGLALRNGLGIHGGLIDNDYRGEIIILLEDRGTKPSIASTGARIAQLMILSLPELKVVFTQDMTATERGDQGLGSAGKTTHMTQQAYVNDPEFTCPKCRDVGPRDQTFRCR